MISRHNVTYAITLANKVASKLETWCDSGFPSIYPTFGSCIEDLVADLPWNPEDRAESVRHLFTQRRSTLQRVKETLGFDLAQRLQAAYLGWDPDNCVRTVIHPDGRQTVELAEFSFEIELENSSFAV